MKFDTQLNKIQIVFHKKRYFLILYYTLYTINTSLNKIFMNNTCFPYQFLYVVLLCDHCSEYSWDTAILTDSHPTLQLIYLRRLPMQYFVPFQLKYIINLDVYELLILVIIQSYFRTSKTNILEDGRLSHKKKPTFI